MSKLKTLKDLTLDKPANDLVIVKELKAEAIKWVNETDEQWNSGIMCLDARDRIRDFILTFFNLTDEDLK